jgi:hypothetical protein
MNSKKIDSVSIRANSKLLTIKLDTLANIAMCCHIGLNNGLTHSEKDEIFRRILNKCFISDEEFCKLNDSIK